MRQRHSTRSPCKCSPRRPPSPQVRGRGTARAPVRRPSAARHDLRRAPCASARGPRAAPEQGGRRDGRLRGPRGVRIHTGAHVAGACFTPPRPACMCSLRRRGDRSLRLHAQHASAHHGARALPHRHALHGCARSSGRRTGASWRRCLRRSSLDLRGSTRRTGRLATSPSPSTTSSPSRCASQRPECSGAQLGARPGRAPPPPNSAPSTAFRWRR